MPADDKDRSGDKYQIGKQVLTQDDLVKVITVKGEAFKVKFPTPLDQERIERDIAFRLGGNPLDSIPASAYNTIRMCVTLDYIIIEHPEWWKSAGECYDEDLLNQLWEKYLNERDAFRRSLRENKFKRGS